MKLKYNATGGGEYTPAPAGMHLGQIVDILEPYEMDSQYGKRMVTRFVIELPAWKDETKGWRFCVRSRPMTLKLSDKSTLYSFVKDVLGRDLTNEEKNEFDPESLLGQWVDVVVQHEEVEGKIYDNIKYLGKTAQANPAKWETTYIRVKDREVQSREPNAAETEKFKQDASVTGKAQFEAIKQKLMSKYTKG